MGKEREKSTCGDPTQGGWGREWGLRQDLRVVGGLSLTAFKASPQFSSLQSLSHVQPFATP